MSKEKTKSKKSPKKKAAVIESAVEQVADQVVEESEELIAALEDEVSLDSLFVENEMPAIGDVAIEEVLFEASSDEDEIVDEEDGLVATDSELEGTELEDFESAAIEDEEAISPEQMMSIVESILFSTDKPVSVAVMKQSFKGTNVKSKDIRDALAALQLQYEEPTRGFTLVEVASGFQLRTKPANIRFLRLTVKARPFKLSGPALEVISICAYKQPVTKNQIDEIRGVESGHLLRALMEKGLIGFGERSDLPGKPMFYETTRKFLEIFGLRNIQELPSLHEIDQLIPEGIGDDNEDKEKLSDLTGELSQEATGASYSEGEDELLKITDELSHITTSSDFFEQEKVRQRERRDLERAQDIREAMMMGEEVDTKTQRWLERYDQAQLDKTKADEEVDFVTSSDEIRAESPEQDEAFASTESEIDSEGESEIDSEIDPEVDASL